MPDSGGGWWGDTVASRSSAVRIDGRNGYYGRCLTG